MEKPSGKKKFTIHRLLQLVVAYNEALLSGRLSASRGGIVQPIFIGSLRKRVEDILSCSDGLKNDLSKYLNSGRWHDEESKEKNLVLLSWYLKWFSVPAPYLIKSAVEKIKPNLVSSSLVPLMHLLFPTIHINALREIDKIALSEKSTSDISFLLQKQDQLEECERGL